MSESKGRLMSLDILRAIAVLLVLFRHLPELPISTPTPIRLGITLFQRTGWMGVDLFFVLSGFLVSGLIFREYQRHKDLQVGRFLARRGMKIYPAFYALLIVTVCFNWTTQWRTASAANYLSELFFLQSYWRGAWDHTWSLAVEEHFYILIAVVVGVLAIRNRGQDNPFKAIPILFGVIACIALAGRCGTALLWNYSHSMHLFPTHLRIDSLMFGVLLSYLYHFDADRFKPMIASYRFPILGIALLLLTPMIFIKLGSNRWLTTFGLTQLYLACGAIVVATVDWRPRVARPIVRLGSMLASMGFYSYSIYLWHLPVLKYGEPLAESLAGRSIGYWNLALLYMMGSIIVGVVMAKLIEIPFLHLRNRWVPSRAKPKLDSITVAPQPQRLAG